MSNSADVIIPAQHSTPIVNSHNEWDPLEEVIVGSIASSSVPEWHLMIESTMPKNSWSTFQKSSGGAFPEDLIWKAQEELEGLAKLLQSLGVIVRRPAELDQCRPFGTPDWKVPGGLYSAMPRDCFLVVGDEVIEVPMAWRSRYFETFAFRSLMKEYFDKGARWSSAPKPQLKDELYNDAYIDPGKSGKMVYALTEAEPVFDAADFARCGYDIFAQRSNVTNLMGIQWLQRHLGPKYRIHVLEVEDSKPMHIDTTFMPLAPGVVLVNPEKVRTLPAILSGWKVLETPRPTIDIQDGFAMCSNWISSNVLMLDQRRVLVEAKEEPLLRAFERWGFEPIPYSMLTFNRFGGGFHCCTLDVRRRGNLESYFELV